MTMATLRSKIQHVIYIIKETAPTIKFWAISRSAMAIRI
jgi:hypothetical protein